MKIWKKQLYSHGSKLRLCSHRCIADVLDQAQHRSKISIKIRRWFAKMLRLREQKMARLSRKGRGGRKLQEEASRQGSAVGALPIRESTVANPLTDLPTELIHDIASLLPPVSLLNLSQCCSKLHDLLTFDNGNLCWYKSLPAAALALEEEHQQSRGYETPEQRAKVRALGGPYMKSFDYKCEVLGHLAAQQRCAICFCTKDSNIHPVTARLGPLLMCSDCQQDYTISKFHAITLQVYTDLCISTSGA